MDEVPERIRDEVVFIQTDCIQMNKYYLIGREAMSLQFWIEFLKFKDKHRWVKQVLYHVIIETLLHMTIDERMNNE